MIIVTKEYFTHPDYHPDLEPRIDPEKLTEFLLAHMTPQVILIWVKENFGLYIHDEIDTGEHCQLSGVVHRVEKDHVILDPWFLRRDFGRLGRLSLQANGVDGLLTLPELSYAEQMSALSAYGLVIPLNQIVMMSQKQGF